MTQNNYQLAVVIINYKTPHLIIDCLKTLLPELNELKSKVIIVDNASKDDSCGLIQQWIDEACHSNQVELIASDTNSGFSAGNNLGITSVNAENYLLLNSDTLVRKGAISLLLNAAATQKNVGIVSPRLEWADAEPQKSCFKFHSPISEFVASAGTGFISKLFKSYSVPQAISDKNTSCEWTSFACVLVKADVFKQVGLMDGAFFMYFEDMVFCYQAKQAGWVILNVPEAHVIHLRGGSSPVKKNTKLRKRLPRYFYESRARCFYLIHGHLGLLLANVLWSLGFVISLLRSSLSPRYIPNRSASQWRDIWTNFFNPLKPYTHPDDYDKA